MACVCELDLRTLRDSESHNRTACSWNFDSVTLSSSDTSDIDCGHVRGQGLVPCSAWVNEVSGPVASAPESLAIGDGEVLDACSSNLSACRRRAYVCERHGGLMSASTAWPGARGAGVSPQAMPTQRRWLLTRPRSDARRGLVSPPDGLGFFSAAQANGSTAACDCSGAHGDPIGMPLSRTSSAAEPRCWQPRCRQRGGRRRPLGTAPRPPEREEGAR